MRAQVEVGGRERDVRSVDRHRAELEAGGDNLGRAESPQSSEGVMIAVEGHNQGREGRERRVRCHPRRDALLRSRRAGCAGVCGGVLGPLLGIWANKW